MNDIVFPNIPNLDKVAAHIVQKCLCVQHGEIVRVKSGIHQYPLTAKIITEIQKLGAFPLMNILDDQADIDSVNEIPDEFLGEMPQAIQDLENHIDVNLIIYPNYDLQAAQRKDSRKLGIRNERLATKDLERKSRSLIMEWPTISKAKTYGMSLESLQKIYWDAFWVDLDKLTQNAMVLKSKVEGAKKVTITSENGKVLEFAIGNRPIWMDTGCFIEELVKAGDLTKNLPCGEVYCSPIEESANGTVLFQKVFHNGNWIRNLELTFTNGRVTNIDAEEGKDIFEHVLSTHSGDKDCIAELGIGLNPKVPETIGNTLLDEKVVGSIHIAIGKNTMYGGKNKSSLHWDLVAMNPTVQADENKIMTNGKWEFLNG